jgi:polysaccharide biosynthesis transport protein
MDVITFAQILVRRWWLVVLVGITGVGVAYYIASQTPPRYLSSVSLQLNPAASSAFLPYQTSSSTDPVISLAASYREVLKSRTFGELVVQQLRLPIPPEAVVAAISTQLVQNTNILRLVVTWDNPTDAQQLAQQISEIFIAENQRRQQSRPGTQAQMADMEQSARDIQARLGPYQQQRDRLDQYVARGDLSQINELTAVDARLTSLQASYANLLVEISRLRSSFDNAIILDRASPPQAVETVPLAQAVVFGLVGGVGAAAVLVLLLEHLADAVRTPRDILRVTGALPLGRVRHARSWWWKRSRRSRDLVMLSKPNSAVAEAIRSLRAGFQLLAAPQELRTIAVTSSGAREGKTFVASNLAIAVAQSGKRVLLVDADLRHPRVHRRFGVDNNTFGFADLLKGVRASSVLPQRGATGMANDTEHGPPDVAGVIASGLDGLWLLPAGAPPPNPGELLSSANLATIINRIGQQWDVVIFDTAPVGPVADTLLLAHVVSGSMIVARSGRTRRAALRGALVALRGTGQPVLGVVLNDERPGRLARFSEHDYYHHGYWSDPAWAESNNSPDRPPNGRSLPQPAHHLSGNPIDREA